MMIETHGYHDEVRAEQVRRLYARLPLTAVISMINATILVGVQWPVISSPILLGWWSGMAIITVARWQLLRSYRRSAAEPQRADLWATRFFFGVVPAAMAWGSAGILLFPASSTAHQMLVIFVLAGMTAASVTSLAADLRSAHVFLAFSLIPLMVRLLMVPELTYLAMGTMVAVYLVGLALSARRSNRVIVEVMSLRIKTLRQADELRQSEEQYRSLVDHLPIGLFRSTPGPGGRVIMANPAVVQMFSRDSPADIYGIAVGDLYADPNRREEIRKMLLEHGNIDGEEILFRRTDGKLIWGLVTAHANRDDAGGIESFDGSVQDITDRKTAEVKLLAAKEAAEQASRTKSQFLANMSHEIRTPMNAVIGLSGLLLDSDLDADQRDYVTMINSSGDSLMTIINDILDFSKINAGRLDLEELVFDLRSTVADTCNGLRNNALAKGLVLNCRMEPNIPALLRGDPGRLRQILTNLIDNGIKFTSEGEVALTVSMERSDRDGTVIRFEVVDTGIGIPVTKQGGLFDAFSQVDGTSTRRFGGTGLGLSICRELCELMGGEIGVRSSEGNGATFWFTVVLGLDVSGHGGEDAGGAVAASAAAGLERGTGDAPLRVLVAEDNPVNQKVIAAMLEKLGHRVDVVGHGQEAIISLQTLPYDIVLMDVEMPDMDGLDTTREIRNPDSGVRDHQVPIIALTAHAMKGDRERCLEAGMNDYLSKPVNRHRLALAFARWSPRKHRARPHG